MGKGREREREEEKGRMGGRAMGTECLCKTKDREESGEAIAWGGGGYETARLAAGERKRGRDELKPAD